MKETQVPSLGQEDPLEKGLAMHSSILSEKSHGQRSLVGYSPWGRKRVEHDLETKQQQQLYTHIYTIHIVIKSLQHLMR